MTFIKLTDPQDKETVVNFDMVCEMRPIKQGTKIFFGFPSDGTQETTDVKETIDQIMAVL